MSEFSKLVKNLIKKSPFIQPRTPVAQASCEQNVLLTSWWLIEAESKSGGKGLGIAGFRSIGRQAIRHFKSTAIIKRHDAVTLETEDRMTITIIVNGIHISRSLGNGFSLAVCNRFLSGFPYDWKEFSDKIAGKECSNNTGRSRTFSAAFPDDLPVAHVRDNLMLSDGDFAKNLIEKLISSHIPKNQGESNLKDVNIGEDKGKCKSQGDGIKDDSQIICGDLPEDATSKAQNTRKIGKKRTDKGRDQSQGDDISDDSQILSGDLSNVANSNAPNTRKIDEKRTDKGRDQSQGDNFNDDSHILNGDLSNAANSIAQNTQKIDEKRTDKGVDQRKEKISKRKTRGTNIDESSIRRVTRSMSRSNI